MNRFPLLPHLLELLTLLDRHSETEFGCGLVTHLCLIISMLFPGVGEDLVRSSAPGLMEAPKKRPDQDG